MGSRVVAAAASENSSQINNLNESTELTTLGISTEKKEQGQTETEAPSSSSMKMAHKTEGNAVTNKQAEKLHEFTFFTEDEIFRLERDGRIKFGIVTDTPDQYTDDEDYDDVLNKGEVRVAFYPDGREIVYYDWMIGLADRTVMPGDVVRRMVPGCRSASGQSGFVRNINMSADVKILGTNYVIKNVPCERLRMIAPWSQDIAVCLDSWIGNTVGAGEKAILRAANGARIEIDSCDYSKFKDVHRQCVNHVFMPNVFYPGNVVVGRLPALERFKNLTPDIALPLNKKGHPNIGRYTVESVRTDSVNVQWQCKAISHTRTEDIIKSPDECIKGEKINQMKRMSLFESCMLEIYDRCYLNYSKCDKLIKYGDWGNEKALEYSEVYKQQYNMLNKNGSTKNVLNSSRGRSLRLKWRKSIARCTAKHNSWLSGTAQSSDSSDGEERTEEIISKENANCENSSPSSGVRFNPRYPKRRPVKKKLRNFKKSLKATFGNKEIDPKEGDQLVVETLLVSSTLSIVWQDGTVEDGVPSRDVVPIRHIDSHEFFPGDFVCAEKESTKSNHRQYGVVQTVDFEERIALVKWFTAYIDTEKPVPAYNGQTEVSVYNLVDHPDFQFRPGTMVLRVANFVGEDVNSTAGQVIDNYPDGRLKVWWVNGHITMCYPQDLFEVGQYEQGGDYDSEESDDSWETESEKSAFGSDDSILSIDHNEHAILAGIDYAKDALHRLESMFHLMKEAQKPEVIKYLLAVYKNCRFLDRLLDTNFFHEDHFNGLVKRKENYLKNADLVALESSDKSNSPQLLAINKNGKENENSSEFSSKDTFNEDTRSLNALNLPGYSKILEVECPGTASVAIKRKSSTDIVLPENQRRKNNDSTVSPINPADQDASVKDIDAAAGTSTITCQKNLSDHRKKELIMKYKSEYFEIFNAAKQNIVKALTKYNKQVSQKKNDSGNYTRSENSDDTHTSDHTTNISNSSLSSNNVTSKTTLSISIDLEICSPEICEVFCAIINEQMEECRKYIDTNYCNRKEPVQEEVLVFDSDLSIGIGDDLLESSTSEKPTDDVQVVDSVSPIAASSPTAEMPWNEGYFEVLPKAPASHLYFSSVVIPSNQKKYQRAIQREYKLLQSSLPAGIKVLTYEDRMDLMSIWIEGPKNTPYEDAIFFFDIQIVSDYPHSPPLCHYLSYCSDRLNPNLYEEGKVCISLLGTWTGKNTEIWTSQSTLLQVLVSIQGLILVDEPYYNEAGFEKQKGTQLGRENSRRYNEMAFIKIVQSIVRQIQNPPDIFCADVLQYYKKHGYFMYDRIKKWVELSEHAAKLKITKPEDLPKEFKTMLPPYPFLPCSRGCILALSESLKTLKSTLDTIKLHQLTEAFDNVGINVIGTACAADAAANES